MKKPYLICTTPRSGSFFLCDLLKSTGIIGHPHEYLTKQSVEHFMKKWRISNFSIYINELPKRTCTENGIYGTKLMWGLLPEILEDVRSTKIYEHVSMDRLLETLFPHAKYIFYIRKNTIRQAISLYKATHTGIWAIRNLYDKKKSKQAPKPEYNYYEIERIERQLKEENSA